MNKNKHKLIVIIVSLALVLLEMTSTSLMNTTKKNHVISAESTALNNIVQPFLDISSAKQITALGKVNILNKNEHRVKIDNKTTFVLDKRLNVKKGYHLEKNPAGDRDKFLSYYYNDSLNYKKRYYVGTDNVPVDSKPVISDPESTKYGSVYDLTSLLKNKNNESKYIFNPYSDISITKLIEDIKNGVFVNSGVLPLYKENLENKYLTHSKILNNLTLSKYFLKRFRSEIWNNSNAFSNLTVPPHYSNLKNESLNKDIFQTKFFISDGSSFNDYDGIISNDSKNTKWKKIIYQNDSSVEDIFHSDYLEKHSSYNWIIENTYNGSKDNNYLIDFINNINRTPNHTYNDGFVYEKYSNAVANSISANVQFKMPLIKNKTRLFDMNKATFHVTWRKKKGSDKNSASFFYDNYNDHTTNNYKFNLMFNLNEQFFLQALYSNLLSENNEIDKIYKKLFNSSKSFTTNPNVIRNIEFNSKAIYVNSFDGNNGLSKNSIFLGFINDSNYKETSEKLNKYIEDGLKQQLNNFYWDMSIKLEKEIENKYKLLGNVILLNKQPIFLEKEDGKVELFTKKINKKDWNHIEKILNTKNVDGESNTFWSFELDDNNINSTSINTQNIVITHDNIGKEITQSDSLINKNIYKNTKLINQFKTKQMNINNSDGFPINMKIAIFDALYIPFDYFITKEEWLGSLPSVSYKTSYTYNRPWISEADFWNYVNTNSYKSIKLNDRFAEGFLKPLYSDKLIITLPNGHEYYIDNNIFYLWELKNPGFETLYFESYQDLVLYAEKHNKINNNQNIAYNGIS